MHATVLPPPGNRVLLDDGSHLAISPDSARIAFVAVDTAGTRDVLMTLDDHNDALPHDWSRDGRLIAFSAIGSTRDVWFMAGVSGRRSPAALVAGWLADPLRR